MKKTTLSVNINKVATIRNARGGQVPNVVQVALDCELFGADGITVHPRPDERHIRYADVHDLKKVLTTEFNIEGYPQQSFIDLVLAVKPTQVTLVPDPPEAITSNAGWDTIEHRDFLTEIVAEFKRNGIRTSIFTDTRAAIIETAALIGTDRIELYTEPYATAYPLDAAAAVSPFAQASEVAHQCGLRVNAGHDLNLQNLRYFAQEVPYLDEVSIGHALISDALYLGLQETIKQYNQQLIF
ncbi:MAG: pyridoxine 5'-phosphate synthase [Paludibacteraceae bacterium]|nr:pyridoxine 5'-phosphate synthase [Paludibacteraceae bacterium]